ncbi:MAG TPA: MBL fold metallo-hydrolase [Nitrososphaera sp.]|nr:MBL fold metallo-hydrolase [Nitrososphaera sp.]
MNSEKLLLRINGILPDVDSDSGSANTSVSIFYENFHLLIDAGGGVSKSLLRFFQKDSSPARVPDAILITNPKRQHVSDLPSLISEDTKVYCTAECAQQITSSGMSILGKSLVAVSSGVELNVGPFMVTPLAADNAGEEERGSPGSVIYAIKAGEQKVVAAWDFLRLPNADESVLWNPDLLVLGAETYNDHPSTGMISVSEAYNTVRRWNAKSCYILHYSGEKDREDARNQWHRGPTGPLSPDALQSMIDDHMRISGGEGKFTMTVAKEGMTLTPPAAEVEDEGEDSGEIGSTIEIDALNRHSFTIEKKNDEEDKVVVSIEDSISRLTSEFVNAKSDGHSLRADGVKGMMMKGPQLELVVLDGSVRIDIVKGKKPVFADELEITEKDSRRLVRYLEKNFGKLRHVQTEA